MEQHQMWMEQCDATGGIRTAFGTQQALNYLIGEKFLDFIETAATNDDFRSELPTFAARIKTLFEPSQLAGYVAPAEDSGVTKDASIVQCASDHELVAKAWMHLSDQP